MRWSNRRVREFPNPNAFPRAGLRCCSWACILSDHELCIKDTGGGGGYSNHWSLDTDPGVLIYRLDRSATNAVAREANKWLALAVDNHKTHNKHNNKQHYVLHVYQVFPRGSTSLIYRGIGSVQSIEKDPHTNERYATITCEAADDAVSKWHEFEDTSLRKSPAEYYHETLLRGAIPCSMHQFLHYEAFIFSAVNYSPDFSFGNIIVESKSSLTQFFYLTSAEEEDHLNNPRRYEVALARTKLSSVVHSSPLYHVFVMIGDAHVFPPIIVAVYPGPSGSIITNRVDWNEFKETIMVQVKSIEWNAKQKQRFLSKGCLAKRATAPDGSMETVVPSAQGC